MSEIIPQVRAAEIRRTRKQLRKDPIRFIESRANMIHIGTHYQRDAALLNNVVSGKKFGDSRFLNPHVMYDAMSVALDEHLEDIYDYLHDDKNTSDFVIEYDAGEYVPVVGTGFAMESKKKSTFLSYEQKINAIETSAIGIVIRKDPVSEYGYSIVSAFPAAHPMSCPNAVKAKQKDLTPILKETWTYQNQKNNDVWRLAARAACRDKELEGLHVSYKPKNYMRDDCVVLYQDEPGTSGTTRSAMITYNQKQELVCKYGTIGFRPGPAGLKKTEPTGQMTPEQMAELDPTLYKAVNQVFQSMSPVGPKPTEYQPFPRPVGTPQAAAANPAAPRAPPPSPGPKRPPKQDRQSTGGGSMEDAPEY